MRGLRVLSQLQVFVLARATRSRVVSQPQPPLPGAGPGRARPSEQHTHEGTDLLEAHSFVRAPGRGVEVVDVEARHGGHLGEGVTQYGRHAGGGEALAAVLGGDPDALDLAGLAGGRTDLR